MDNVQEQLEQARSMERAGQHAAALDLYVDLAEQPGPHLEEAAFWARLGDLRQRAEQPGVAADSYERAVDLLVAAGQRNNAMALCRRVLRADPERVHVHLRRGELAAEQGYPGDAREGFLTYADAVAERGDAGEALRVLQLFRSRFPQDAGGRRALAERLLRTGREDEAVEELRRLWALLRREGEAEAAERTRDEILSIRPERDPELEPVESEPVPAEEPEGGGLELLSAALGLTEAPREDQAPPAAGLQPTSLLSDAAPEVAPLEGLEPTHEDYEPGGEAQEPLPLLSGLPGEAEHHPVEEPAGPVEDLPLIGFSGMDEEPPRDERPEPEEPAREPRVAEAPRPPEPPTTDYVDLGALILSEDVQEVTRFRVDREQPTGDEDRDFTEILNLFRQQLSEGIDPQDAASHYDLGLAFKEMGLLDDAITQLQTALRGGANPLATLEVLGECFMQKSEHSLAARVFARATRLQSASEPELIGVYYLLGRCEEELGRSAEARGCYEHVVAVDMSFRDAAQRLESLRDDGAS